jgi:predicted chitinase
MAENTGRVLRIKSIDGDTRFQDVELVVLKKTCYCNRDFTEAEVTNIITQLRKKDDIHQEQQFHNTNNVKDPLYINDKGVLLVKKGKSGYYDLQDKFVQKEECKNYKKTISKFDSLGITIFQSKRAEKIQDTDANIATFTKELNKALTAYTINTCIRKIHFLAQCYHESGRFVNTYEGLATVKSNYRGGADFQGRGLKQITHDDNYLEYYDKINGTTLFKDKYRFKHKSAEGVTDYMKRVAKNGFPEDFLSTLKTFAKKLSTELYYACDSAGWFWDREEINKLADQDNVAKITAKINGGDTGLTERNKYANDLKIIFDYEKCSSKK